MRAEISIRRETEVEKDEKKTIDFKGILIRDVMKISGTFEFLFLLLQDTLPTSTLISSLSCLWQKMRIKAAVKYAAIKPINDLVLKQLSREFKRRF
jgi:hypothetical protein